jgi:hypothetical protein
MNVDRYTKFVLTYIAICLTLITAKETGILPNAYAQRDTLQRVVICDSATPKCADVRATAAGVDGLVVAVPNR